MFDPDLARKEAFASQMVARLADVQTPASEAVSEFRSYLGLKRGGQEFAELLGRALCSQPMGLSNDSLLPKRLACAVVLEGLRLNPPGVDDAFTRTYRRAVHFVLQIGAEVARQLSDERIIISPNTKGDRNPDDFYRAFSYQLSTYVDGMLGTIDLARNKQLHYVQKGVVAERLALATEMPRNIEATSSHERAKLNRYFISEAARILNLEPEERTCLRQRVEFCVNAGRRNKPYDYSILSRALVVDHEEPVRFAQTNMDRPSFLEALNDMPQLIGVIVGRDQIRSAPLFT